MDLIYGTVRVSGKKQDVINMYENLFDYYDKGIISQRGTDDKYNLSFDFASKVVPFFGYDDYFLDYSKDYKCHIVANLSIEGEEDEEIKLEYNNGKVIHGMSEYNDGF